MTIWAFTAAVIIAVAAYVLLSGFLSTWRKYHGVRVITCPENFQSASVRVDAFRAAQWAAVSGEPILHLDRCSRWPEMKDCRQECLKQVEDNPEDCAVRNIVARWYEGKSCVYCRKPIGQIVWHERPPAVRSADGLTQEWKDIAPEELPEIFRTHQPVCFSCNVSEAFLRDHPELVVSRGRLHERPSTLAPSAGVY